MPEPGHWIGMRSRRHIPDFTLHRPTSLDEAVAVMRQFPRARPLGGGIDLLDAMKWGEAVDDVIELRRVAGLADIRMENGALVIGAGATHAAIADSPVIAAHCPDLADLWRLLASPRIRFSGTLGGNLMSARPHYDALPALLALDATALLAADSVWLPIEVAVRRPSALLVAIRINQPNRRRLLVQRELHPAVAIYLGITPDGVTRVAIGGAHATACCAEVDAESPAASATRLAGEFPATLGDAGASAAWRSRMIAVLTERALRRCGAA